MNYSLSLMLGRNMALGALDPDAVSYIAAVRAAGGTVSGAQATVISNFVILGKADGWFSSIKRFYLPIWGVAAANAICLKSLVSGTFFGGVTHGTGFVRGNGTTGYFSTVTTVDALGINNAGLFGCLVYVGSSVNGVGHYGSLGSANFTGIAFDRFNTPANVDFGQNLGTRINPIAANSTSAILCNARFGVSEHRAYRRSASGIINTATSLVTHASQSIPTPMFYMAIRTVAGGVSNPSAADYGCFFASSTNNSTEVTNFTLAIKNLWEGTTGLTLP
jgi:hypothetical protein